MRPHPLVAVLLLVPPALAPTRSGAAPPGGPPSPPPEAYSACAASAASDGCAVELPDRTVAGTCTADEDGALFCHPARPPRREPPPEAYAACASKAAAAACSVQLGGGEALDGTCVADGEGEARFCLPDRMPPAPRD